jgi:uncharacterized protein (TIGR00255 family)
MTGFGAVEGEVSGACFSVELRTVNNRYLKIATRLQDGLQTLTPAIEELLRKKLSRGSVTVNIRMKFRDDRISANVNREVLRNYIDQLRQAMEVDDHGAFSLDIGALLQLPGVIDPLQTEDLADEVCKGLLELVGQALETVVEMRATEGRVIVDELMGLKTSIDGYLDDVRGRADKVVARYHERIRDRATELSGLTEVEIDGDSLAREVAFFAERCDIAEEISRLSSHLDEFERSCGLDEPIGRKLDFIAQEMLREANTIASKGMDEDISRLVVDIKTAVDRIKEQAANLE